MTVVTAPWVLALHLAAPDRHAVLPCCAPQTPIHPPTRRTCIHLSRLEAQQREARALTKALAALHSETSRLNGLLAEASGLRSTLHEDNLLLEGKLQQELKASAAARKEGQSGQQGSMFEATPQGIMRA